MKNFRKQDMPTGSRLHMLDADAERVPERVMTPVHDEPVDSIRPEGNASVAETSAQAIGPDYVPTAAAADEAYTAQTDGDRANLAEGYASAFTTGEPELTPIEQPLQDATVESYSSYDTPQPDAIGADPADIARAELEERGSTGTGGTPMDPPQPGADEDGFGGDAPEQAEEIKVPAGSTDDVLAWVDGDADRAQLAYDHEQEQSTPRKGLSAKLKEIIGE